MPAYAPNDSSLTPESIQFLHSPAGQPLLQAAASLYRESTTPSVSQIASLRKSFSSKAHVPAALTLASLQKKAQQKFPELPFTWATPEALEQATDAAVARHKATFLHLAAMTLNRHPSRVFDLCAGIGGDTLHLADVFPVTAIDLSATRTTCLRLNAISRPIHHPINIITADIRDHLDSIPADAAIHMDPSRRSNGKRSPQYGDLIPPPEVLDQLFAKTPAGMIKLSPAVDFDELPEGHLELISHNGSVVQALLWRGFPAEFHGPARKRTVAVLWDGQPGFTYTATPATATACALPKHPEQHFLYELDGAFTRARLAGAFAKEHHLQALTADGGYLLSSPRAGLVRHPALVGFQLLAVEAYHEKKVLRVLAGLAGVRKGAVEVKTRGLPELDTDGLQRRLGKEHGYGHTVLVFRHGGRSVAAVGVRV